MTPATAADRAVRVAIDRVTPQRTAAVRGAVLESIRTGTGGVVAVVRDDGTLAAMVSGYVPYGDVVVLAHVLSGTSTLVPPERTVSRPDPVRPRWRPLPPAASPEH